MSDKSVPSLVFPDRVVDLVHNRDQPPLSPTGFSLFSPRVSDGRLFVQVVSCIGPNIFEESSGGYYCVLVVEKQTHTTATVEPTFDITTALGVVEWGQMFNFDFTQEDAAFHCNVWARSKPSARFIGEVSFSISELECGKILSRSFDISNNVTLNLIYSVSPLTHRKLTENDFKMVKVIGKGSFGTVYQVIKKDTNCIYAMKVLAKKNIIERNAVRHAIAERTVLKNVHHPFLVHLKYAFQTPEHLFMVIDYLNGGELFYHLQQDDSAFGEARAKFYASEIVLALGYLHDNNILYRDLKPENILLDMEGHVCIVDFGLCKTNLKYGENTTTFCGSLEYMAPEVLAGESYRHDVDWWALATMVYEMIEGIPPFWDEETEVMVEQITRCDLTGKFDSKFSPECIDFISQILILEPEKRLGYSSTGTEDIKSHKWFQDVDWVKVYNREIQPAFKPHVTDEFDTKYFDEEVTAEDPEREFQNSKKKFAAFLSKQEEELFGDFNFEEDVVLDVNTKLRRTRTRGKIHKLVKPRSSSVGKTKESTTTTNTSTTTTIATTTTISTVLKKSSKAFSESPSGANSQPKTISEKNSAANSPVLETMKTRKSSSPNFQSNSALSNSVPTQQSSSSKIKSHKKSESDFTSYLSPTTKLQKDNNRTDNNTHNHNGRGSSTDSTKHHKHYESDSNKPLGIFWSPIHQTNNMTDHVDNKSPDKEETSSRNVPEVKKSIPKGSNLSIPQSHQYPGKNIGHNSKRFSAGTNTSKSRHGRSKSGGSITYLPKGEKKSQVDHTLKVDSPTEISDLHARKTRRKIRQTQSVKYDSYDKQNCLIS